MTYKKIVVLGLIITTALAIGIAGNAYKITHIPAMHKKHLSDWQKVKQQQAIIRQVEEDDRKAGL